MSHGCQLGLIAGNEIQNNTQNFLALPTKKQESKTIRMQLTAFYDLQSLEYTFVSGISFPVLTLYKQENPCINCRREI